MEFLIIPVWAAAVLATVGVPAALVTVTYLRDRRTWTRLSRTGVRVRGKRPPDEQLDTAFLAFQQAWRRYGFGGDERLEGAMRSWRFDFLPGDSFSDARGTYRGLTVTKRFFRVAERFGAPIGRLTVFHESVHGALWALTGEPDPDHEGAKYPGWSEDHTKMVDELKRAFAQTDEGLTIPAEDNGTKACGTCARAA